MSPLVSSNQAFGCLEYNLRQYAQTADHKEDWNCSRMECVESFGFPKPPSVFANRYGTEIVSQSGY